MDKPKEFVRNEKWTAYAEKEYDPLAVGSIDKTDSIPHDLGIVRAIDSEYFPDKRLKSNPNKTIFVARLHPKVTEENLVKFFVDYGPVKSCRLVTDIVTGFSKQYGFVEFEKIHHAERAYRKAHHRILNGLEVLVDYEFGRNMKNWKPRRLGGGFGGRKESGQLRFGCRDRKWKEPIGLLPETRQNKRRN